MDIRVVILLILEGLFALWLLRRSHCLVDVRVTLRCALLLVLALFIRLAFFDRENTDYQWFLKVWVDFYRTNPGFSALGKAIGNYNIPYLYFLALFARSSIRDLYLIKLLSVFFDILLAWAGLLLVRRCGAPPGGRRGTRRFPWCALRCPSALSCRRFSSCPCG